MNNLQLKPIAKAMVLAFALSANALHSADKTDPATPPSQGNALIPKRYLDVPPDVPLPLSTEELGLAFKERDAMNPRPLSSAWQARIIETAGIPLTYSRTDSGEIHVFKLPRKMTVEEAKEIADRIRKLPEISFVYTDPVPGGGNLAIPTDPLFSSQWNLKSIGGGEKEMNHA